MGEFGRTPKINGNAGRDHWPDCYTRGAGRRRRDAAAPVYGASDQIGAYPATDPVTPGDIAATIFWRFGIDPATGDPRPDRPAVPPRRGATFIASFRLNRYSYRLNGSNQKGTMMRSSLFLMTTLVLSVFSTNIEAEEPAKEVGSDRQGTNVKPYGIDKRVTCDNSRVVGSPNPPSPYRVKKAFPELKVSLPDRRRPGPGTDQLAAHSPGVRLERGRPDPPHQGRRPQSRRPSAPRHRRHRLRRRLPPRLPQERLPVRRRQRADEGRQKDSPASPATPSTARRRYPVDPKSAAVIIEWESNGHNGGDLAFGNDGMLYVSCGDGTSDSDTEPRRPGPDALLVQGAAHRRRSPRPGQGLLRPEGQPVRRPAGRPARRRGPTASATRGGCTSTGRPGDLWVGQNGQDLWEQAYLVKKGANYGWSVTEGSHPFYPNRKAGPTPISKPTVEHPHSEFRSLTGGVVYRGRSLPELAAPTSTATTRPARSGACATRPRPGHVEPGTGRHDAPDHRLRHRRQGRAAHRRPRRRLLLAWSPTRQGAEPAEVPDPAERDGPVRLGQGPPPAAGPDPLLGQRAALVRRRRQGPLPRPCPGTARSNMTPRPRLELPRRHGAGQDLLAAGRRRPRGHSKAGRDAAVDPAAGRMGRLLVPLER